MLLQSTAIDRFPSSLLRKASAQNNCGAVIFEVASSLVRGGDEMTSTRLPGNWERKLRNGGKPHAFAHAKYQLRPLVTRE